MLLMCTFATQAKVLSELRIGDAHPMGAFLNENQGAATDGLYVGYKLLQPILPKSLFWSINFGLMYNRLNSEKRDYYNQIAENTHSELALPGYINIPVMTGLHYEIPLSGKHAVYGLANIGFDMFKMTNYEMMNNLGYEMLSFPQTFSLGYNAGIGYCFNNRYVLELTYWSLGNHKITSETIDGSMHGTFESNLVDQLNLETINLSFGIRF